MVVASCTSVDQPGWLGLREALWPHACRDEHLAEMAEFLAQPDRFAQFVAYADSGEPAGLVEASLRSDYVNGTVSSPVAFLEGIFVAPEHRRGGVARRLVEVVSEWAAEKGCHEFASDALLDNAVGQAVHKALGFEETQRVVYFRKPLVPNDA